MDGDVFAKNVGVADSQACRFAVVFDILRGVADFPPDLPYNPAVQPRPYNPEVPVQVRSATRRTPSLAPFL